MNRREHLLSCLAEECTEVGQRVSKGLRFGEREIQPGQPLTNAERLREEWLDLCAVAEMLHDEGVFDATRDGEYIARKRAKVEKFMVSAREQGALQDGPPVTPTPRAPVLRRRETFFQQALHGAFGEDPEKILDAAEEEAELWHASDTPRSQTLAQWLGLSEGQYRRYVRSAWALIDMLNAAREDAEEEGEDCDVEDS